MPSQRQGQSTRPDREPRVSDTDYRDPGDGTKPAGRFEGCDTSAGSEYAKSGLVPRPRQTTSRCFEGFHPGEGWRDERRAVSQAGLYGSPEPLNSASQELADPASAGWAWAKRCTNASAVSATSRQPLSMVRACPRPGISTISVTFPLRCWRW